jgi:serine/threonine-protein kinase RsbW
MVKKNPEIYTLELESDPREIYKVEGFILSMNEKLHIGEEKLHTLLLVVSEAVNNGITHGNKRNRSKKVHIQCSREDALLTVKVRDEGEGFNHRILPDPRSTENLLRESGRGVFLMREMMDSVSYNDKGTEVTMVLKID